MPTVSKVIQTTKQPYGGYLKLKSFREIKISDENNLYDDENVIPRTLGILVDYLTRFLITGDLNKSFSISIKGSLMADLMYKTTDHEKLVKQRLSHIKGLDDTSITNACQLVGYDAYFRDPFSAMIYRVDPSKNKPDKATIHNIRILVQRCIAFFEEYGPIKETNITFEGGYTSAVTKGDADYLTKQGLWDLKVSKMKPRPRDTLQILLYWIMGMHTGKRKFKSIKMIGMLNPRLSTAYFIYTKDIPAEIITQVEDKVLCY